MNVLRQAALIHEVYDKLGTPQRGWNGTPFNYNYSSALIEIVNFYARPGGRESPENFAKKSALAARLDKYVADRLKDARAAGMTDEAFFKSKAIARQYQDTILALADRRSGTRSGSRSRTRSRSRRTRRG